MNVRFFEACLLSIDFISNLGNQNAELQTAISSEHRSIDLGGMCNTSRAENDLGNACRIPSVVHDAKTRQ
jgi:hypothetical protein